MDMISASFRGEYDSIQRVIPTINAAAVATKALEMTGKSSADQLTEQEKAMATYQLLLEGAGPATGDFARTQDGAANSTRIATAQIRTAGEQIGAVFLPIVAAVAGKISEWADKFAALDDRTKTIIVVVAAVAAAIGPLALLIGGVTTVVGALSGALAFLAANPVVLIIAAIAALVAGLVLAYQNVDWFRNAVDTAWQAISQAVQWAWENVLRPIWDLIVSYITNILVPYYQFLWMVVQEAWERISSAATWAWDNVIQPVFEAVWGFIQEKLIPAFQFYASIVQAVWERIAGAAMWFWEGVGQTVFMGIQWALENVVIPAFNHAKDVASTVFGAIGSVIGWAWGNVISPTFGLIRGAIDTLVGAFQTIKDTVVRVFDSLAGPIRSAFQAIKDAWNNTVGGKGISIPGFLGFDGINLTIPRLHSGGVFQSGSPGGEGLALLRDGEMVLTPEQARGSYSSSATFQVTIVQQPGESTDALVDRLDRWARQNGRRPVLA
jgi:hypothetical protein